MRFVKILATLALLAVALFGMPAASRPNVVTAHEAPVPPYNHIIVLMEENHGYSQIIGNPAAPKINQLAQSYGLATDYTGVGDPSAPNYVGILGGNTYGIADDNPYYTHTIHNPSIADQLEGANLTWKGYFQSLPYAGYKGICYPTRCDGTPDVSAIYAAKHNGFPYFTHIRQNPQEMRKLVPITQFDKDLQSGQLPNFSFVVPNQCFDMHGAPPYCVDDGAFGSSTDNLLMSQGDTYAYAFVQKIITAPFWLKGNNAVVITWDEGNSQKSRVSTIVITSHGPRHVQDSTPYNHYSLLLTIERAFHLGCLQHTCDRDTIKPMVPLFAVQSH